MENNAKKFPILERPPIVETVLGVQFTPIAGFTAAHFGWYWKQKLDSSWTKAHDVPRLLDQFERFGDQQNWGIPMPMIRASIEPERVQFVQDSGEKLIQIQSTRFIYNWKKHENAYPSFDSIFPEFLGRLKCFEEFLVDARLDPTPYNQWELSYVNHIPKGSIWDSPSDFAQIFPGLFGQIKRPASDLILDQVSNMARYEISPRRGRVTIHAQLASNLDGKEVLLVTVTGRGPVMPGHDAQNLALCFTSGHDATVQAFFDVASESAILYWKSGVRP
jgi:uncharacterized protein (TIGR04255 family)